MKATKLLTLLVISSGFAFLTTSCSNADNNTATNEALTTTAMDEAQAASLSDAVISESDVYSNTLSSNGFSGSMAVKAAEGVTVAGPTITVDKPDSLNFPKTVTIDYGTTGVTGKNGNTLKGKIIITISKQLWKPGAERTIKLVDFYVNDNNVKGIKTITNNGLNAAKNPSMTVVVSDTIIRTDKSTIIRNATRTRERISDNGTPRFFADDEFSVTGSSVGINAKGVSYTVEIIKPLIYFNNYPHFVQGTIRTTTENRTAELDYGDGTRDALATVTINGVTKNITLRN